MRLGCRRVVALRQCLRLSALSALSYRAVMPGEHTPDGGRFYGLYEGVVIANDHPEKAGW